MITRMMTAVILYKNESNRVLKRCLRSVSWCNETLVVVDAPIAGLHPATEAKIYYRSLNGDFSAQRNFALSKAKDGWVLFIDSDEVVSPALASEISNIKPDFEGFYLKRRDVFWGKELKHGEAGNIKLLRLGKKGAGEWQRKVHEVWQINGPTKTLNNYLYHYPHPTISEFLNSINNYTDIDILEQKKFSYFRLFLNPPGKFIYNYFIKLGFLDGWPGLIYAFMMSFHSLLVRVKMWESHGL